MRNVQKPLTVADLREILSDMNPDEPIFYFLWDKVDIDLCALRKNRVLSTENVDKVFMQLWEDEWEDVENLAFQTIENIIDNIE